MRASAHAMKKPYAARDVAVCFSEEFEHFRDRRKISGATYVN
jgi:hypothetical protein